jgi:hypothetical protein
MIEAPITAGALCQNLLRLANLAEPAYRDLIGQLRLAMVVHADETGWRIGTLNAWLQLPPTARPPRPQGNGKTLHESTKPPTSTSGR